MEHLSYDLVSLQSKKAWLRLHMEATWLRILLIDHCLFRVSYFSGYITLLTLSKLLTNCVFINVFPFSLTMYMIWICFWNMTTVILNPMVYIYLLKKRCSMHFVRKTNQHLVYYMVSMQHREQCITLHEHFEHSCWKMGGQCLTCSLQKSIYSLNISQTEKQHC